jgi:hypothetical protein
VALKGPVQDGRDHPLPEGKRRLEGGQCPKDTDPQLDKRVRTGPHYARRQKVLSASLLPRNGKGFERPEDDTRLVFQLLRRQM